MKNIIYLILVLVNIDTAFANKAIEAFEDNNYQTAKQIFQQQLKQQDNNNLDNKNQALIYLARIAINENMLDDAEKYLKESIKIKPNNADEYYWYAVMSSQQASNASIFSAGAYASDARKYFNEAIKLDAKHIKALRGLVEFYIQAPAIVGGSNKKAKQTIEKIKKVSPMDGDLLELSLIDRKAEPEQALEKAKKLVMDYKYSAKAVYAAGMTFQKVKKYSQAMQFLRDASAIKTEDKDEQLYTIKALYQLGRTSLFISRTNSFSKENLNEGINAFTKFLALKLPQGAPDRQWAKFILSLLYTKNGDNDLVKVLLRELKGEIIQSEKLQRKLRKAYEKHEI